MDNFRNIYAKKLWRKKGFKWSTSQERFGSMFYILGKYLSMFGFFSVEFIIMLL